MGFQHTIDMSYFLEMFQFATEEFIKRNRETRKAPWPLISPVCPVVVRLIAFQFPSLMPNVLPVLRPVALMAREVKRRIIPFYMETGENVALYYINPCPTKMDQASLAPNKQPTISEFALGINDIYPELAGHVRQIRESDAIPFYQTRFEYETCATGNASMWAMSGGEIADMDIEKCLAVSGLEETITYLQKIEMGLFQDIEYIEFRTCREGCLGGVLNVIDKYLAKSAVQKMIKMFGLGRHLPREKILRLYEKGDFQTEKRPSRLLNLFGGQQEGLSIESMQKIEKLLEVIEGRDCAERLRRLRCSGLPDIRRGYCSWKCFHERLSLGALPGEEKRQNAFSRINGKQETGKESSEMQVKDLVEQFGLVVVAGDKGLERPVKDGYCGDLLSEIMANAPENCVWLTIQGHQNIVAVALLREMAAIIITGGQTPDEETLQKANQEEIPILLWSHSAYQLAGRLYALGIGNPQSDQT
jgi:hypothetical protein